MWLISVDEGGVVAPCGVVIGEIDVSARIASVPVGFDFVAGSVVRNWHAVNSAKIGVDAGVSGVVAVSCGVVHLSTLEISSA